MVSRALLAGALVFVAALAVSAAPALAAPILSIESPASGSVTNNTHPVVSGVSTDGEDLVTVEVRKEGSFYESAEAEPDSSGAWSVKLPTHLDDGEYTVSADQTETLTGEPGTSGPVGFTVDTQPPSVTLNAVSSPTNDTTPSFSGTASETTGVTVLVFKQGEVGGTPVAEAHAFGTGGAWSSGEADPELPDGTYTAVAEQESAIGNGPGFSQERTFTVHAGKPVVTLNPVSSPTTDTTPSFSGTASEKTPVTVDVYAAGDVGGTVLAEAEASGTGGSWSSGGASPALADGTYTAVAVQESAFGNGPGTSQERTFTVHTAKPVVTLNSVSSPTTDTSPSFSGTASEKTTVKVLIFKGGSASGSPVAKAEASGTGGSWSSGGASPALADGTYTAVAEQESSFGTGPGRSAERTFAVDTQPPEVTLNAVTTPSNVTTPSFTGKASDTTTIEIRIFKGSSASGSPVATATATGTGGAWSSGAASPALAEGSYTAVAVQESSHGTGEGESEAIHFTVVTASPKVTLNSISPSGNTAPTFSGTASDSTAVTILVYEGSKAGAGPLVASAGATGTGGGWTSGHASPALAEGVHEYTAIAEQDSSLGNPSGASNEVHFVVDTRSPTVTLDAVPTPSNDATPTFSGTASDKTSVLVRVFDAGQHEVANASGAPSGGKWTSGGLSKTLASGSYTAVAEQTSSLGNPAGKSENVSFTVNTESPHVTLQAPAARSSNTTPSFSGTATDTTTVTVSVFKGTTASGSPVATATAAGTGGAWTSGTVSKELETGTYTARAVQKSSIGNPDGVSESRTFEIDTRAPEVTLNAPPARSNVTTPSFSGTASDAAEPIVVSVFKGASASGSPVATATAAATGGAWASGPVSKALEPGTYTARAAQKSSIKNPEGLSEARTFVIDTSAPAVKLEALPALSNNSAPTFKGTASDTEPVTVSVYAGSGTTGTPVATAGGAVSAGAYTTSAAAPALPTGSYTAVARQPSSIGNPAGESNKVAFAVNTSPPAVTMAALPARSNNRTPTFTGIVVDNEVKVEPVTVRVFDASEHEVASATATPSGGKWTTKPLSPALAEGAHAYTAVASQPSSIGNGEGQSARIAFTVDTTPPAVTLEPVATPSNNVSPTFSGTASETGPVKVEITGGGKKLEVTGTVAEGKWTAGPVTLPKVKAEYVAIASQASSIGNAPGKSKAVQFLVDPSAPSIFMAAVKAQINTPTPTFTGTAGGSTPVTVAICKLTTPCAAEQGEWVATSGGGGAWAATLGTPLPDGQYQAIASERSATDALGATERQIFTVDTVAPAVTVTAPAQGATVLGSSVTAQGAGGAVSHDHAKVTVELFEGSSVAPGQSPVQAVEVAIAGGSWSAALGGLKPGAYTVRVTQSDDAGNLATAAHSFVDAPPAAPASGPTAAFNWFPSHPHVGETVTLVSTSTDTASPLTGFAWNLLGSAFATGGQKQTTSFSTPGNHPVGLRVSDAAGLSGTVTQQIPVSFPLMRPFPAVRIVTTRSGGRLRLKLLTVEAPAGTTVTVTCTGKGCPVRALTRLVTKPKAKSAAVASVTFPRLQRVLPAGVALEIRAAAAGKVGKFTRFAIRKGKLPLRSDACVNGKEPRPVPCSS